MRQFRSASNEPEHRHAGTAREMVERLAEAGYAVSLPDFIRAWEDYSDSFAAGWLGADGCDGHEIFSCIRSHLEEVEAPSQPDW